MLWTVEGKRLKKPSYLFGTVHLANPEIVKLHPLAEEAFNKSDRFHNESSGDELAGLAAALHLVRRDGKSLDQSLGPERAKQLRTVMKNMNPDASTTSLQRYKTWAAAISALQLVEPKKKTKRVSGKTLDKVLWARAEKMKMVTGSLGTQESEFSFFDKLSEEEQVTMLFAFLENATLKHKKRGTPEKSLVDCYLEGDLKGFTERNRFNATDYETDEGRKFGKRFHTYMVTERSETMAKALLKKLAATPDEVHFVAVGVGHFVGDVSIRTILEKHGYTLRRLTSSPPVRKRTTESP